MEYARKYGMGGNVDRLRMAFGGKMEYADEGRKMPYNFVGRKRGRDADTPFNDAGAMDAGLEIDYSDKYRYLTEQEKEYAVELESAGLLRTSGKGGGYITPQSMKNLMSPKARLAMASMMRQIEKEKNPAEKVLVGVELKEVGPLVHKEQRDLLSFSLLHLEGMRKRKGKNRTG